MKNRIIRIIGSIAIAIIFSAGLFSAFAEEPKACSGSCMGFTSCSPYYGAKYELGIGTYCCKLFPAMGTGLECVIAPPPGN